MKMKICWLLLILISLELKSQEIGYIGRSPRALLMGDAYTAVADDEYTLFYNPAAMGRNNGVDLTPLNPSFGGTNALGDLDRFKNFPSSDPAAIADRILNYPLTIQAAAFPGLKLASFGFNLFANSKTNFILRNAIHPTLDVDYRYDRGFITGFALDIGSGAKSSRIHKSSKVEISPGQRASIGFAVKHINREGISNQFDLFGTKLLSTINSGSTSMSAIKSALGFSKGAAWGFDMGAEYALSSGPSLLTAGISILDVGGTRFTKTEGTAEVPTQDMTVNTGVAFKQDFGIFDYTLSADMRPITSNMAIGRQFHFGSEVSLPFITINAGWSEGYVSYGGSVKLWPFKLTAGLYGVELGSVYREQQAKRFILYLSLFDFSFDI